MMVVFVVAMIVGFALGVRVMVSGVLRANPAQSVRPVAAADRVAIARPLIAVVATAFGLTGVLLTRVTTVDVGVRTGVAAIVAIAAATGAVVVIRRWARASDAAPLPAEDDPRFALQGLPAHVTRALGGGIDGEIEYQVDGVRQCTAAVSIDRQPIAVGVEVVIDRVDRGVAWVESWDAVEQRM